MFITKFIRNDQNPNEVKMTTEAKQKQALHSIATQLNGFSNRKESTKDLSWLMIHNLIDLLTIRKHIGPEAYWLETFNDFNQLTNQRNPTMVGNLIYHFYDLDKNDSSYKLVLKHLKKFRNKLLKAKNDIFCELLVKQSVEESIEHRNSNALTNWLQTYLYMRRRFGGVHIILDVKGSEYEKAERVLDIIREYYSKTTYKNTTDAAGLLDYIHPTNPEVVQFSVTGGDNTVKVSKFKSNF